MGVQLLINPSTREVAAELFPGEKVVIHEPWILKEIAASGITVSPEFKQKHDLSGWRIYPAADPAIFALAFKNFSFAHGLQQQGYFWRADSVFEGSVKAL